MFLLVWFFVSVEKVEALESFSIMVLPDTQYYSSYPDREAIFVKQTEWIRDNAVTKKVKMVLHEGDLINSNNSSPEWVRAKNAMSKLGTIPYALSLGNHDYSGQKDTTFFNAAFPASNFIGKSWFGGVFEKGKMDNAYYVFEAGGKNWLVLSLEYGPRQVVVDWAKGIVANNSDKLIILLTHGYMAPDGSRLGTGDAHNPHDSFTDTHDGDELWEELVKPSRNIVMVLSGHVVDAARRVDTNNFGKNVYQILSDYQNDPLGGNGYLRIMEFFPDQGKVNVKTFSPWLNQYKTEDKNQFELNVDWWKVEKNSNKLTGTFLESSMLSSENQIGRQLDEVKALGMDTVVLQSMKTLAGGCGGSYQWNVNMPGNLKYLFSEAKKKGIKVWVGTALKAPCYQVSDEEVNKKVAANKEIVDLVESEVSSLGFGDVLAGYYLSDEPSISTWAFTESNYREVKMTVDYLRGKNRKSMISPILWVDSSNPKSSDWVRDQAVNFASYTKVDIQAWQDGTGAYATATEENNPYNSKKYFEAMVAALGKDRIWADIELFNWGNDRDYSKITSWYRPAILGRILNQIANAGSTGKQLCWIQQHHMQSVNSVLYSSEARGLYDAYIANLGSNGEKFLVKPKNYSWSVAPSSSYVDSGNEMFDGYIGNPKRYMDQSWVGFLNDDPTLNIDLNGEKPIKWIRVHVLNSQTQAIYFPNKMEIKCGTKTEIVDLAVSRADGELVMQNKNPLGAKCSNLNISFINDKSWTFLSEIEIVADNSMLIPSLVPSQVPTQTPTQVSVLGDANRDGKVDLVDFSIWKSEYLGGMKIKCDFNKDGSVNLVDFGIWKKEYLN